MVSSTADGQFVGSMDLQLPLNVTAPETVRCDGVPFPTRGAAEQDVARRALKKLHEECDVQVKDVNYEDSVIYKNLYEHQLAEYTLLFTQFTNVTREYNVLKDCYIATLAQKNEYASERVMLRHAIGECHSAVNQLIVEPAPAVLNPSEAVSTQHT